MDVTSMLRRVLILWPDVSISRTAPYDHKKGDVGRFSWDATVTVYPFKGPCRPVRMRARTLPAVLRKVIAEGEKIRAARRA